MNKFQIVYSVILLSVFIVHSCAPFKKFDYSIISNNKEEVLTKSQLDSIVSTIEKYHPNPYGSYSKSYIDSIIKIIVAENKNDSLSVADWTLEVRKLVDIFSYNDPHITFSPFVKIEASEDYNTTSQVKKVKVLPFDILQINDTVLIKKSYNDKLLTGDIIISINGISIKEFQKYIDTDWRTYEGYTMQIYHQISFSETYAMTILRAGVDLDLNVKGILYGKYGMGEKYITSKLIDEYKVGYIKINEFIYNKQIVSQLLELIKSVKKKGYQDIIIDIRDNPGGSGSHLAELFSIMSDKDSLLLHKSQYIKVSSLSIEDYGFLNKSQIGEVVKMPDSLIYKSFYLSKAYFESNFNYYIMVNKSTSSTAAAFANIAQYNSIGKIVGEPLLHNAHVYGDICYNDVYQKLIISTMQYNEYTKAINGIIYPDIHLPYVAKDYIYGEDSMLEKLLENIKGNNYGR